MPAAGGARSMSIALLFFTLFAVAAHSSPRRAWRTDGDLTQVESDMCVYTMFVATGTLWKAGTDAAVGVRLCGAAAGDCLAIPDLEAWGGLMWPGHDYFELGGVDAFSGRARCLASPPCSLELLSGGGGGDCRGWYCDYVQVAATSPEGPFSQRTFKVGQWLSGADAPPFQLRALRDECDGDGDGKNQTAGRKVLGGR